MACNSFKAVNHDVIQTSIHDDVIPELVRMQSQILYFFLLFASLK